MDSDDSMKEFTTVSDAAAVAARVVNVPTCRELYYTAETWLSCLDHY